MLSPRRTTIIAVLCVSLSALASAEEPDASTPVDGGMDRLPPLQLEVDRSKVDLDAHRFELKMSRSVKKVRVRVRDAEGNTLAEEEHPFQGEPAGTPLTITWTPTTDVPVARVEVWGYDTSGYWAGVAIIPWAIRVPHEEVLFDTAKAVIKTEEEPKLEASYAAITKAVEKHRDLGNIVLFIAGHTDRVGTEASNLALSRKRANAIAAWFKARGLTTPIAWEGFGEAAPAVKTGDGVAEPRNRRVDYILAIEPPTIKTSGDSPVWKKL